MSPENVTAIREKLEEKIAGLEPERAVPYALAFRDSRIRSIALLVAQKHLESVRKPSP